MLQDEHWHYTLREWSSSPFKEMLEEAFTRKIKTVWDVGACVGGWSYLVSQKGAKIHAFEPFPDNYNYLVSKEIENVTPHNYGIWYGKNRAEAIWRGSNVGAIFVDEVDTTDNVHTGVFFDLKTLEDVDAPKPDLVKLDIEGAEKNLLENTDFLKTVPQIIIEWHFNGFENAIEYFKKYLPNHKVIQDIEGGMFLLRL